MKARSLFLVLGAAALLCGGSCAGYRALPYQWRIGTMFDSPFDEMRFDRARWISGESWAEDPLAAPDQSLPGQSVRGMMLDDLMTHHLRSGMTRAEVKRLLGSPDSKSTGPDAWTYALGAWSGMRMDEDYLTIEFDAGGLVTRFGAWQS